MRKIISCVLSCLIAGNVFAATSSLHLQLPDKLIDINKQDVEQLHIFQLDRLHYGVMLKLNQKTGAKLMAETQGVIGKPVVWIWNGRAVSIEKLAARMDQDINVLNLTRQEAFDMSNKLLGAQS